jgi:hypothetical protein
VEMMGWDESVMRHIVASNRVRASRKVWLKPWVGAIASQEVEDLPTLYQQYMNKNEE